MEAWETSFFLCEPTANQEVNACAGEHLVDNGGVVCALDCYEQWWALDKWSSAATRALYPANSANN